MRSHILVLSTLLLAAMLGGCAAEALKAEPADIAFAEGDEAADSVSRQLQIRGAIHFGESVTAQYAARGYAGWLFTGAAGARVSIDASATDGTDTVLYVYGPQTARSRWSTMRPIAVNDDRARRDTNSPIDLRLPAAGTYLVIVREYYGEPGSFTLALGCSGTECRLECGADDRCAAGSECNRVVCIRAPCPSYCETVDPTRVCDADEDCVAVDTGCCSCAWGGGQAAYNAGYADEMAPVCDPAHPVRCLAVYRCGAERPACVANRCEMVPNVVGGACDESECGPQPRVATIMCEDGSTGGFTGACNRGEDGTCGWEIRECPVTERRCGGRVVGGSPTCEEGEFCDYPVGAICGWADAQGVCRSIPDACPEIYQPVCGCDRRDYSSACHAAQHGIAVLSEGTCSATE